MRGKVSPILLLILAALIAGCAHRSRPEGQTQFTYISTPVIDFGRGGGGLPVEGVKDVRTAADLLLGLTQGYKTRVELPKDHDAIMIAGEFPHLDLLRKVKEAEIAESLEHAQQGERMAILDPATPPAAPDRSRVKLIGAGVVASVGLALCMGLLLEWRDPVLSSVRGIESASGLPVLGSVPRIT